MLSTLGPLDVLSSSRIRMRCTGANVDLWGSKWQVVGMVRVWHSTCWDLNRLTMLSWRRRELLKLERA